MGNVFLAVDYGPEHLESPSLGGRPLRISPSWHQAVGKRGRGVGVSGPAGAVSRWPFRRDFKTALAPGREAFGIFFCPFPYPHVHTLHREEARSGARHSSKNRTFQAQARSDSLLFRNSDIRSRLAHPLSWNETRACGGPLRSDVATAEEEVRGEQLVGRSGQGPGGGGSHRQRQHGGVPRQGRCESAPPWPEAASELQPPATVHSRAS